MGKIETTVPMKKRQNTLDGYLSEQQAAHALGVWPATLKVWAQKKKIKHYMHPNGTKRLYMAEDIENFLKATVVEKE